MSPDKTPWNSQEQLKTPEDVADYLEAAFDLNDPAVLRAALLDIAKSQGMRQTAVKAGITREGLYKSLSPDGDPKLSTLLALLNTLGLKVTLKVA
ncbi:MAG: putative addiction module antidote protein [Rhodobacteraceae bacterium]|nr:putative addiction module antidote protein [Paracoccaceae bacterium]